MSKQYLLFDLDGTLTDPMEGITKSVQYALERFGISEPELENLCCFIGPPLKDSFMKYYGFSESQAEEAIQVFREYFSVTGLYENKVFSGMEEMLKALKEAGKTLLVATSKPEHFARQILSHFQLDSYFAFIGGADMAETRVKKGDVVRYVLEESGILEKEKAVMVGDREHDILGAKENGLDSVGVLFGYGDREELEQAEADWIVETVEELKHLLLTI